MNIRKLIQIATIAVFSISGSMMAMQGEGEGQQPRQGRGAQNSRTANQPRQGTRPNQFQGQGRRVANAQPPIVDVTDFVAGGIPLPAAQPVNGAAARRNQQAVVAPAQNVGYATQAGQKLDSMISSVWNCVSNFCLDMYASAAIGYDNTQHTVASSRPVTFASQHGRKMLYGLAGIAGLYATYRLTSGLYNMGYNSGRSSIIIENFDKGLTAK